MCEPSGGAGGDGEVINQWESLRPEPGDLGVEAASGDRL